MKLIILLPVLLLLSLAACEKTDSTPGKTDIPAFAETQAITLPVVFHIIHSGDAPGTGANFSADSVARLLDYLNRSFAGELGGEDSYIRFRLAVKDPNGNALAEPGIHRMSVAAPYDFDSLYDNAAIGRAWEWNPAQYINISYVDVEATGGTSYVVGFAYFPFSNPDYPVPGLQEAADPDWGSYQYRNGIYLRTDYLLSRGPRAYSVLTHEMGHQLGLYHVFSEESCADANDYCEDTHDYYRNGTPPSATRTACDGVTFIANNYLDYDPVVRTTFTTDQIARMRRVCNYSPWRGALHQSQMRGGRGNAAPKGIQVD